MNNGLFTQFAAETENVGITLARLGEALSVWAFMQSRPRTVAIAAIAFNTTHEAIVAAVDSAYWIFLEGIGADATIEFEGE